MNPLEPRIASLVTANADLRKRVLDLERRINGQVRMINDLDDATVTYLDGDPDDPGDGDALTWSLDRQQWVPGPSGGRRVAWKGSIDKVSGSWSPTVELAFADSGGASSGGGPPPPSAVDAGAGPAIAATVNVAGVWMVTVSTYTGSPYMADVVVDGPNWSPPGEAQCLTNRGRWKLVDSGTAVAMAAPAVFWLPEGSDVTLTVDASSVDLVVDLLLYMETPVDVGTCGGE